MSNLYSLAARFEFKNRTIDDNFLLFHSDNFETALSHVKKLLEEDDGCREYYVDDGNPLPKKWILFKVNPDNEWYHQIFGVASWDFKLNNPEKKINCDCGGLLRTDIDDDLLCPICDNSHGDIIWKE